MNAFFWQLENLSSRSVKIGIAKTETKRKHPSPFEEASRLNFAAVVLYERKYRPLARKMECNYVMMSWEKMAKKNCHAKHDGCCFSMKTAGMQQ